MIHPSEKISLILNRIRRFLFGMGKDTKAKEDELEKILLEINRGGLVSNSAVSTPKLLELNTKALILAAQVEKESSERIINLTEKLLLYTIALLVATLALLGKEIIFAVFPTPPAQHLNQAENHINLNGGGSRKQQDAQVVHPAAVAQGNKTNLANYGN
jgi:hypothetical protein